MTGRDNNVPVDVVKDKAGLGMTMPAYVRHCHIFDIFVC